MYLTQFLHRASSQHPHELCTVDGDRRRTWAESTERIARIAAVLDGAGVGEGDRVAVVALNSDALHEVLLGVAWAGAIFVPINTRWNVDEIAYALSDSGSKVAVVDATFAAIAPVLLERCTDLELVLQAGPSSAPDGAQYLDSLLAKHEPVPDRRRGGHSECGIFYTGGTTGRSKGVVLSHANLLTSALGTAAADGFVVPGGRTLLVAPMFHAAGFAMWMSRCILGGTLVMRPAFNPAEIARLIGEHQITDILLVPSMIQMLLDCPESADADLSSLRRLVYGASPISETLLERTMQRMPDCGFVQAYGMTELSPCATALSVSDHRRPDLRRSAGRALPHSEVAVVDADDRPVPVGTPGEVTCRGGHVMLRYWRRPEETAAALRGGAMHTGDWGYLDDEGYLFILDRLKDMIISGGENVYSVEVENVLVAHPDVAACAVIGLPDEQWGERVHAVVVPVEGRSPDYADLAAFVRERVAGYKAPRSFETLSALPLSPAGKVLKRELRAAHTAADSPTDTLGDR